MDFKEGEQDLETWLFNNKPSTRNEDEVVGFFLQMVEVF